MAFSKARRLSDFIASDGTVPTGKFASGSITSDHIANLGITHADLHTNMDLTGKTVLVANASTGDSDTTAANTAFVQQEIAALVDSSPSALNTLNELAAALGDDANFSTTVTNSIATKLPLAGGTMTGRLDISHSNFDMLRLHQTDANGGFIKFTNTDDTDGWFTGIAGTEKYIISRTADNSSPIITIEQSGNVGIGTSDPALKLHVSDSAAVTRVLIDNTSNATAGSGIYLRTLNSGSMVSNATVRTGNNGDFSIWTGTTGEGQRLTIDGSGNVGIGTTDPTGKLHISGGRAGVISTSSSWGQFRVGNTNDAETSMGFVTGATESDFLNDGDPACAYKVILGINPYGAGTRNFGIGNDTITNYHTIWTEGGHQLPRVDNTYDLGSTNNGFRNVHLSSNLYVGGHIIGDDDTSYMRMNAGPSGGGAIYLNGSTRTNYENHIQYMADVHNFGDVDGSPINTLQVVSDSELVTINGRLSVTKPIQTTTDTGTRMYTGLATGSHYSSTGYLILDTNIPSPNVTGNNMFSIHINGYSYDNANGGIIDLNIGTYSGESYFHNPSYSGSNIPDKWVNNVRFARKTATDTVSIILGDSGTSQPNEVAATLFIQGYVNRLPSYAEGWDWKIATATTGYTQLTKVNEKSTKRPSFSAGSSGFSVGTGWQLISDSMSQTHDGPDDDYNPSNGRFTPQLPGWYQFNFGGWASYNSSTGQERYAVAFAKNGSLQLLAGGNYSAGDSPLCAASRRVYLNGSSDYVELRAFSSVATTWGGGSHHTWWDGYWTGS